MSNQLPLNPQRLGKKSRSFVQSDKESTRGTHCSCVVFRLFNHDRSFFSGCFLQALIGLHV